MGGNTACNWDETEPTSIREADSKRGDFAKNFWSCDLQGVDHKLPARLAFLLDSAILANDGSEPIAHSASIRSWRGSMLANLRQF